MIHKIDSLEAFLQNGFSLENCTIQQIDFSSLSINWKSLKIHNTTFLGCNFKTIDKLYLVELGALVLDSPDNVPYNPFRKNLYTWQDLLKGFPAAEDLVIYNHFQKNRFNPPIIEALWQRVHDHAIDTALREYISMSESGMPGTYCVGIMGGHKTPRNNTSYYKVALLSKKLTEAGYLIVSGGGPGIMEAANLGAFLANKPDNTVDNAMDHLSAAPVFSDPGFSELAIEIWQSFPDHSESLAIPTWFYGHEPSNVFATSIAKYFSNSIREDTLLAICLYGIIFAPGSAGTVQEIFMDAAQNHYGTYNYYSPMIFLGKEHYEYDTAIFPLLKRLARSQTYEKLLFLSDEVDEILRFIQDNPPVPVSTISS